MNESQKTFPEYHIPETGDISAYLEMEKEWVNSDTKTSKKPLVMMHALITLILVKSSHT